MAKKPEPQNAERFTSQILYEMARMSSEDSLVMQLHVGSFRNHNLGLYQRFGSDVGADVPTKAEFTKATKLL